MLRSILKTATFRQSQITTLGTIINGILGAFFYILVARFLGPSNFGFLTVYITTLTLIADIVDFGINTGLVRFVSASWFSDKVKALKFLKLGLESKILIWVLISITGFISAPTIAEKIFNKPELVDGLRLAMFGVGGALLFTFATSALQSFQRYLAWSILNILTNLSRLFLVGGLIFYQQFNLQNGLLVYITLPFFGFFLSLLLIPSRQILSVTNESSIARKFFNYNLWVAAFTIVAAISSRLDTFLNVRLLSAHQVGIYGAANQLTSFLPQLVGALGIVAAPKFSSFQNISQMLVYFKKFQLMVLGIAAIIFCSIPISFYFIPLIYGQDYQAATLPFIILLLAMIIFLISVPLHSSIIYYFGKPQVFVWTAIFHLLIVLIVGYFLILNYGVNGAAITVVIGMMFNFFAPLAWFLKRISKKN